METSSSITGALQHTNQRMTCPPQWIAWSLLLRKIMVWPIMVSITYTRQILSYFYISFSQKKEKKRSTNYQLGAWECYISFIFGFSVFFSRNDDDEDRTEKVEKGTKVRRTLSSLRNRMTGSFSKDKVNSQAQDQILKGAKHARMCFVLLHTQATHFALLHPATDTILQRHTCNCRISHI